MCARWMNAPIGALRDPIRILGLLVIIVCLTTGWIGTPSAEAAPTFASAQCTIKTLSGSGVGVRSGPGASYALQGPRLKSGTKVQADSRNSDRTWVHIVKGGSGWIPAYSITCNVDLKTLPVTGPPPNAPRAPGANVDAKIAFNEPGTRGASFVPPLQWVQELDVDRGGRDYRHFDLAQPDPGICQRECANDNRCWAYVYAEPGVRFTAAHCWLKDVAPPATPSAGYISGVKVYGSVEKNIDRPGWDYDRVTVSGPDQCAQRCLGDSKCWAYTYVDGTRDCWLKSAAPAAVFKGGCMSGAKVYRPESQKAPDIRLGPAGGSGGGEFADAVPAGARVVGVQVWSGLYVDAVQMFLNTGSLNKHGGGGGSPQPRFSLRDGEYITAVSGRSGVYLDQISFRTNQGRAYGPYGGNGGNPFAFTAPPGYAIVGLFGRSGAYVDAIGAIARKSP